MIPVVFSDFCLISNRFSHRSTMLCNKSGTCCWKEMRFFGIFKPRLIIKNPPNSTGKRRKFVSPGLGKIQSFPQYSKLIEYSSHSDIQNHIECHITSQCRSRILSRIPYPSTMHEKRLRSCSIEICPRGSWEGPSGREHWFLCHLPVSYLINMYLELWRWQRHLWDKSVDNFLLTPCAWYFWWHELCINHLLMRSEKGKQAGFAGSHCEYFPYQ